MSKVIQLSIPQEPEIDSGNLLVDDIETIPYKNWIDSYIDYIDFKYEFKCRWPNVWINMIYLDENYSHIREYWNQDKFSLLKGLSLPYRI